MRHQKGKAEKWIVKTIKCIYSEPGILILMRILSFYPSIPTLSALEPYMELTSSEKRLLHSQCLHIRKTYRKYTASPGHCEIRVLFLVFIPKKPS